MDIFCHCIRHKICQPDLFQPSDSIHELSGLRARSDQLPGSTDPRPSFLESSYQPLQFCNRRLHCGVALLLLGLTDIAQSSQNP